MKPLSRQITLYLSAAAVMAISPALWAREVAVSVKTDNIVNKVNPLIYGHFFEHIYHSANNGLWGEVVWNRSFEQNNEQAMGSTGWSRVGDVIVYSGEEAQSRITGAYEYRDFDYTVEARKTGSAGGLRIIFRGNIALTLGGVGNTQHSIDANVGGGGRRGGDAGPAPTLAEPVAGTLAENQWYKVRVRMEGVRLQAWLDDKQLFDVQTPAQGGRGRGAGGGGAGAATASQPSGGTQPAASRGGGAGGGGARGPGGGVNVAPQGWIGVGVVAAKAEFRNFLVKGLDGKVFWNEPLPAPVPNSVVERWGVTGGTARIINEAGQALNDARCLELTGASRTVLTQPGFYLKANDPLEGSLWLKGRAPGGATVQFVEGETVLAEQKIDAPGAEWKEYPLRLNSARNTDATLRIILSGDHQVMIDQVSLMPKSAKDNGGFRTDMYDAFKGLAPTAMRWPGGCYAETYKWKHGIGPQKDRKKGLQVWWEEYDPNALGTDEYIALSRKIGSEPLLVIQTGMHQGQGTRNAEQWEPFVVEACEWLEYCNGPVTSKWGAERAKNGHPEPYHVKLWEMDNELWRSRVTDPAIYAEAIKLFSDRMKKVDPTITIIGHGGNGTDRNYNIPVVNNAAEKFSILSIHHYTGAPQFVTGIAAQDALYTDVENLIKGSKNPDIRIYVSEWNAQTTDWRTGIYAGGILNTFEKHGEYITMAGPALMARHTSAHGWDNAFINFDNKGWFAGPNYVVMKLWRESFAPNRVLADNSDPSLNLIATKTENGDQVILKAVNLTDEPLEVNAVLDATFRPSRASMKLVAPGSLQARNSMSEKEVVKVVDAPATVAGNGVKFSLPAYSTAAIRVSR